MRRFLRVALPILTLAGLTLAAAPPAAADPPRAPSVGTVAEVVRGAGTFEIDQYPNGTVTARRLSGTAPAALAYPAIGPYMTPRWHDTGSGYTVLGMEMHYGHPYVCVESANGVDARHPISTATEEFYQYDFVTEWSFAGCGSVSDRYKMTTTTGARRDTCIHSTVETEVMGGVTYIRRMIKYFDELNETCFIDAEVNAFNTSTALGSGYGLLWHRGDDAPSLFSYDMWTSPYTWATDYDLHTIAYYN